jgi:hypothetical protein
MTDLVKRVARAIAKAANPMPWDMLDEDAVRSYHLQARAAIAAMREPTEAMIEAVPDVMTASEAWQAMIDAALSPGERE